MRKIVLSCCLLLCFLTGFSAQKIAVLDFNAKVRLSQEDVDGLSSVFNTYFTPSGYTMVERVNIDRIIDELKFQRGRLTDAKLLNLAVQFGATPVMLCTGDIFVEKENVPAILGHFPDCEVVDMESAAIAQVCHIKKTPFLSLRVISDSADSDNNLGQYINFWDEASKATFRVVCGLPASLG